MNLGMWSPVTISNDSGKTISILTAMCDLQLSVISYLMYQFILTRSCYSIHGGFHVVVFVVVIDADRKFYGVFDKSLQALKITVFSLAQGNHRENSVDK